MKLRPFFNLTTSESQLEEDKESTVKPQSQQIGTGKLVCFIYSQLANYQLVSLITLFLNPDLIQLYL
jgi:hypothetical protein